MYGPSRGNAIVANLPAIVKHSRYLILLIGLAVATGCGARIHSYPGPAAAEGPSLSDTVCVVVPPDGKDAHNEYAGSGKVVATHILGSVRRTWPSAVLVEPHPLSQAQIAAKDAGCSFAVVPMIELWEDRPCWRGRDHVVIRMFLMQVGGWTVSRSVTFDQYSGNTCSHDHPASEILDDGFDPAIAQVIAPLPSAVRAVKTDGVVAVPLK